MTEQTTPASVSPPRILRLPFPLQQDERITMLVRKHWWFLWPHSIVLALVAVVPVAIVWWLLDLVGVDRGAIFWGLALLWIVYWVIRLLLNYYRYHNDIWLVTNQRLIDSYKSHPFNLRLATADLVNIQDMSVVKNGILASLLGFGNVVCETAGADHVPFLISGIPHPEEVQLLIDKERDRERGKYSGGSTGQV